jgi:hypothetical protein
MSNVKSILAAGLIAAGGSAALGAAFVLPAAVGLAGFSTPAYAACLPGAKIDKSTAAEARSEMQKAGFSKVHDLKKGCDNYWHGIAMKNGSETHVVASPQGKVMTEGD